MSADHVVDDHTAESGAIKADLDLAAPHITRCLEASPSERKGVVGEHGTFLLNKEQFVVDTIGREKPNERKVEAKAIDGAHLEHRVLGLVVLVFYPRNEGLIERFEACKVESADQENFADSPKNRSIFPFAAPSRTGVWQSKQPRRVQIGEISFDA